MYHLWVLFINFYIIYFTETRLPKGFTHAQQGFVQ